MSNVPDYVCVSVTSFFSVIQVSTFIQGRASQLFHYCGPASQVRSDCLHDEQRPSEYVSYTQRDS
jgi:hypothetical protein